MTKMSLLLVTIVFLTASALSQEKIADSPASKRDERVTSVQTDVLTNIKAVYAADIETVVGYTHSKVIELMGGEEKMKVALQQALGQIKSKGMKIETLHFPADPTFLTGTANEFVIVPTKMIISAGGQRVESLNYQFGVRANGEKSWKYIEGSRINRENVGTLFPDFPTDYKFPPVYRKLL